jgi:hypothetical protein
MHAQNVHLQTSIQVKLNKKFITRQSHFNELEARKIKLTTDFFLNQRD